MKRSRSRDVWRFLVALAAFAPCPVAAESSLTDLTELSLEELASLQVTSVSKQPENLMQAPAAVAVITQDDIRRSGVTSIPEALRLAPGVEVARIGSSQWSIGIRGFGDRLARSVLVLIDGRAVYAPLFAGTYWEVQDYLLEDIDRIEVIRGPGGTLWGANAFNGVINIITKKSQDTQGGLLTAGGGTEERAFGSVRLGGKAGDNGHYRVYGKYFNRDASFHHVGNDYDDWDMGQGGFRTDWTLSSEDSLTVQGDLYAGKTGSQITNASYTAPFSRTITDDIDVSGANLLSRWSRELSPTAGLSVQTYYDRTNRVDLNFREFRDTLDFDFQNNFSLPGRQNLTWGVGYRYTANRIDSIPTIVFDPKNRTDELQSFFIQDQIGLLERVLNLTLGTKVEHNDFSGWEVEPSGRLSWTPTENQTFWTAVSRAVRTPSQVEQDLQATIPVSAIAPLFVRQVNNKDFDSEELIAYEAGYRVQPAEPVFVDVAVFYNDYDNLLSGEVGSAFAEATPAPPHFVLPVVLDNKLEGETHGMEWATTWRARPGWQLRGTYTLLLMHLREKAGSTDTTNRPAKTQGSSPRHQALLESVVELPAHWEWSPMARYTDALSYQGIPAYWSLDMRLAWNPTDRFELALVGQNLLQKRHAEYNPNGTPTAPGLPLEIQRGFYGKLSWRW